MRNICRENKGKQISKVKILTNIWYESLQKRGNAFFFSTFSFLKSIRFYDEFLFELDYFDETRLFLAKLGRVMQGYMQHSAVSIFTTMTSLADWFNITSPSQIKTLSYSTIQLEWKKKPTIDIAHWCTLRRHVVSTWTCSFEYTYHFWTIKLIKEDLWLQR